MNAKETSIRKEQAARNRLALRLLDAVESGKVAVVPMEPTHEILQAIRTAYSVAGMQKQRYKAAIAARPDWKELVG